MAPDPLSMVVILDAAGLWTVPWHSVAGVFREIAVGLPGSRLTRVGSDDLPKGFPPVPGRDAWVADDDPTRVTWLRRPVAIGLADTGTVLVCASTEVHLTPDQFGDFLTAVASGRGDSAGAPWRDLVTDRAHKPPTQIVCAPTAVTPPTSRLDVLAPVAPESYPYHTFPLALGRLVSLVNRDETMSAEGISARLIAVDGPEGIAAWAHCSPGAVWLLSYYSWTSASNAALAAAIRQADPTAVIVAGGPDIPRDPRHLAAALRRRPQLDVVVHGEGELTLLDLLAQVNSAGLRAECPIAGATLVVDGKLVHGPARERIADLSTLPSPYLDGTFDTLAGPAFTSALIETNRGCPYGCTFCDWGAATLSRIRSFPLDTVLAEIDWVSAHQVIGLGLTDANFGILPRDNDIAAHICAAARTGYPGAFTTNYAKNPKRNVIDIVDAMRAVGLVTVGRVSLQTTDDQTLADVHRRNISAENYVHLIEEFHQRGLPIVTDLLIGLPGATIEAFVNDLQFAIDNDMHTASHRTRILPNSPMADDEYRLRFRLDADGLGNTRSSTTFDEESIAEMARRWAAYFAADNLGTLRLLLRFWRHETGRTEMDLLAQIRESSMDTRPCLAFVLTSATRWTVPPPSWDAFRAELAEVSAEILGRSGSDASAVLEAQSLLWPRTRPDAGTEIAVEHDVVGWWLAIDSAKRAGEAWERAVAPLGEWSPGTIAVPTVDDPEALFGSFSHGSYTAIWELTTPLSRPGWTEAHLIHP